MKINVDEALAKNSSKLATSLDIGASALVMEGISDPKMVEAMACWEGLALANDLMFQKFKLTTDCLNVVRSLQRTTMETYGNIVREIKARTANLAEVSFVHERREANGDAHWLAKGSLYESLGRHVRFLAAPDGVYTAVSLLLLNTSVGDAVVVVVAPHPGNPGSMVDPMPASGNGGERRGGGGPGSGMARAAAATRAGCSRTRWRREQRRGSGGGGGVRRRERSLG
ncbi:hypothetical protein EJB05_43168, partial [Eragrostis curvula]